MLKFLFFFLFFLFSFSSESQIWKGDIKKEVLFNDSLAGGEEHQYSMMLNSNRFVYLELEQKGIDIIVAIQDPVGNRIGQFDTPNGSNGLERIAFNTTIQGEYTVFVVPYLDYAEKANYSLKCVKIDPVGKTLETFVDQLMFLHNEKSPGEAVSIVHKGEVVFSKGYGSANLEYDIPISDTTVFHIASISKQVTAFSILLLEEKGLLSLDDDVRKYLPEVPDFGETITLRHLANHTSGLRDQWNLLVMAGWDMEDVITTEHVMKVVSRQEELNFSPGTEMLYSNTGYTLLAEVVARVSGKSFSEFTNDEIFEPLGMKKTQFYDDHHKIVRNRAYSYMMDHGVYKKLGLSYSIPGATSLFTTVNDLALWSINFEQMTVGNTAIFNKMNTSGVLLNGEVTNYSLGQAIGDYRGLTNCSHGGADAGYRTIISRFPDQEFSVIVFANQSSFNPRQTADMITNMYLRKEFPKEKIQLEPSIEEKIQDQVLVPAQELSAFLGEYEIAAGIFVEVYHDGALKLKGRTGVPMSLTPISNVRFEIDGKEGYVEFLENDKGHVVGFEADVAGQKVNGKRLARFNPEEVDLSAFVGVFHSEELATSYTVEFINGQLLVSHSKISDFVLRPIQRDKFTASFWAFGSVEYERNAKGEVTGFRVSNGRVQNVLFKLQ